MNKFLFFLIFLIISIAGFDYYSKLGAFNRGEEINTNVKSREESGGALSQIKKEIFTSGPLKSLSNERESNLTRVGTINQTNQQRSSQGLPPLTENQKLNQAALQKVKDMFNLQYFEHVSPSGQGPGDLADDAGYEYIAVGENLALGNFKDDAALVEAWMNSPGHRANILNSKYTEIGVAVLKGTFDGKSVWLSVQEFGKPESACPGVDKSLKTQMDIYKGEIDSLKPQLDNLKVYLDSHDPQTKEETDEYNQKVGEFNALVKSYNNKIDWLKSLTEQYNGQVNAFNACVGS